MFSVKQTLVYVARPEIYASHHESIIQSTAVIWNFHNILKCDTNFINLVLSNETLHLRKIGKAGSKFSKWIEN